MCYMMFYSIVPATWDTIVARFDSKKYTLVNVKIDGDTIDSVGVRIKGNNFSEGSNQQALKIDFDEFIKKGSSLYLSCINNIGE